MIGVFDSGLGGLSVLAAIARLLPRTDLVYLADTAHLPYGSKDDDFIRARVLGIGRYLVERGCNLVVVACNTATAAAVEALRVDLDGIPVVGVEPGVKPAALASATRRIAVLATESTARSERLAALIDAHAGDAQVHVEPCPGWATRIESLQINGAPFAAEVRGKVESLLDAGVDRIILGCTHYSFLTPMLDEVVRGRAELVDVADAVARQVERLAAPAGAGERGELELLATADPERLRTALPRLGLDHLAARTRAARLAAV